MRLIMSEGLAPITPMVVKGEDGKEKYRFEMASRFTWKLTNTNGDKILSLYQEWDRCGLKPLRPCHGTLMGTKFTARWEAPVPPMYDFGALGWKAEGDWMRRVFTLTRGNRKAGVLKRHWLRPWNYYTLDIPYPVDEKEALTTALCIHLMKRR